MGVYFRSSYLLNKFKTLVISKALISRLYQQDKRIALFNMLDYSFNNDKNNNYMYKTYKWTDQEWLPDRLSLLPQLLSFYTISESRDHDITIMASSVQLWQLWCNILVPAAFLVSFALYFHSYSRDRVFNENILVTIVNN